MRVALVVFLLALAFAIAVVAYAVLEDEAPLNGEAAGSLQMTGRQTLSL